MQRKNYIKAIISNLKYPVIILALFFSCCKNEKSKKIPFCKPSTIISKGTIEMIDSLQAVYTRTKFLGHPYELNESLTLFDSIMTRKPNPNANDLFNYATNLLRGGRYEDAIQTYKRIVRTYEGAQVINTNTKIIYELMAISYLRKGEVENCVNYHNSESCIIPIRGNGFHILKTGSLSAIEIYKQILEVFPEDYESMYLMNIAYMTLGKYPKEVPKKWYINLDTYKSEFKLPRFENIASKVGVDNDMSLAGGVVTEDFDNDGFIDILVSSWGMKDQLRYYKNNGDGTFTEKTEEAGITGLSGGLNMQQADYNNDGFTDVFILRGAWKLFRRLGIQPCSLLKNNGDGTFTDVTREAGVYSIKPTLTCRWFDFNNDGNLDLYVGAESLKIGESFPSEFFVNNGNGTFTNMAKQFGMDLNECVKGVAAGDYNNDGLQDLYLSTVESPNKLFLNKGGTNLKDWKFEEIAAKAGVQGPMVGFPCMFFDFNNDGFEDIFNTSYDSIVKNRGTNEYALDLLKKPFTTDKPYLFLNNKNGTFTNVTKAYGLDHPLIAMGCNYGDLDNDGYLDFYLGTGSPDYRNLVPNKMFRNNSGKNFQDVTSSGGFGNVQKGHAISWADLDNDGDQDIYAKIGGAVTGDVSQSSLFENPGNNNKWIVLLLQGTKSNRSAIGAKIKLTVKMADGKIRNIYNTVSSGASFGANSLQQEIGLGKAKEIINVEVNWPNGKNVFTSFGSIALNKKYLLLEGKEGCKELPYKAFKLKAGTAKHSHNPYI